MVNLRRMVIVVLSFFVINMKVEVRRDNVSISSIAPSISSLQSNRYTQMEDDLRIATNDFVTLDDYLLLGSNKGVDLYVKESDLSFRIVDEKGYVWGSSFISDYQEEPLKDEGDLGANLAWKRRFNSPLIINYYQGTTLKEENIFQNATSSLTYELLNDRLGFKGSLHFGLSNITLSLYVYLEEGSLRVEIPFEEISEGEFKLANVLVYPYFGATKRKRIAGYTMVPDGVGALIRHDDTLKQPYIKRFYGPDLGIDLKTSEDYLYVNTYGMVHGVDQHAFLSVIDKGASHAILSHFPSRNTTDFNHTYVTYEYRTSYTQYLNQSKTSSVNLIQKDKAHFDVKQSYYFLYDEEANYVGMAHKYQDLLIQQGLLTKEEEGDIPLHLDILMSESKKAFIGRTTFAMTTIGDVDNIFNDFYQTNIPLSATLYGWASGYSYSGVNYKGVSGVVGSNKALKKVIEKYPFDVYLDINTLQAYKSSRGYQNNHISQSIGQQLILEDDTYYLKPSFALSKLKTNYNSIKKFGAHNIHLGSIGHTLYSDFSSKLSRQEAAVILTEFLEVSSKTSISRPFSYLMGAEVILDSPMYSSQQLKLSDTVPFLSIILSGYKEVYARNGNFFSNSQNELLRMIDYQLYPSYLITKQSSYKLLNTGSESIYTSSYDDWKDTILDQYTFINNALKHVKGATIIKREVLDYGFVKVTYNNGVLIYINYSGKAKEVPINVAAMSYEVVL